MFLGSLIKRCYSAGVFLKDSPAQPVSWVLSTEFGSLRHLYTLEDHRRKGYAKIVILEMVKEMLKAGVTPELEVDLENPDITAVVKLYIELGFVESYNAMWKHYGV